MTNTIQIANESRRHVPQGAATLTLAIYLPRSESATAAAGAFEPNAFVRIGTDNTVTAISK